MPSSYAKKPIFINPTMHCTLPKALVHCIRLPFLSVPIKIFSFIILLSLSVFFLSIIHNSASSVHGCDSLTPNCVLNCDRSYHPGQPNLSSMEESEFSLKFICVETLFCPFGISSHPLFSFTVTLCTLILLYLPHLFWKLVLSPVLILTGILLLTILRFGANQRSQIEQPVIARTPEPGLSLNQENRAVAEEKENLGTEPEESNSLEKVRQWITDHSETEFKSQMEMGFSSKCFVESWDVKAPLEVIYEEHEGEEEEAESNEKEDAGKKYPSLSRYYPESESDSQSESSSDYGFPARGRWELPVNTCFQWDEEDREGLIEIALDCGKRIAMEFQFEEDNLIEIDISPTRHDEFPGENEVVAGEVN